MTEPFESKTTSRSRSRQRRRPSMSERQLQAYFLSREAIRRIRRASELFGAARLGAGHANSSP